MEPNQEDTNEPLKAPPVNQFEAADSTIEIESPPPQDKNDILYIVLIASGIGFALPFYRFAFDSITIDVMIVSLCVCVFFSVNQIIKTHKILFSVISWHHPIGSNALATCRI